MKTKTLDFKQALNIYIFRERNKMKPNRQNEIREPGVCPDCGGELINCEVADDVCLDDDCGFVGQYYYGNEWH